MKNVNSKIGGKFLSLKEGIVVMAAKWLDSIKKDFSFYNEYTELLAIWTLLFITITGLFVFAIRSSVLIMFLSSILAFAITFAGSLASISYLYSLKYQNKKSVFTGIHSLFNKSFKLRSLLRFIKLPRISVPSIIKNLRLAS
jgi:hypothetical protein